MIKKIKNPYKSYTYIKYILNVWRENETEKPCWQFTADLPWWNNSSVCKKREAWSTQSALTEVPEPQRTPLQATKGISAGGDITQPYVSAAGGTSSSSSPAVVESSETVAVLWKIQRVWGVGSLWNSCAFFLRPPLPPTPKKCCVTMKARLYLL